MNVSLIIIAIAIVMVACQPVGFWVMGVKKPKTESEATLHRFVQKRSMQYGRHVISSYNGYLNNFGDLGLTTIHIFSREGKSVNVFDHAVNTCGPDPVPVLREMKNDRSYALSGDSLVLDSITARLLLPDGSGFHYQRPDSVDFVAVITWAKWIGKKVLDRDVASCVQAIANNKQVKFDLIMVNLDKQVIWGTANLEKVKLTRTSMEVLQ
jgi:hypothetical protein